MRVMENTKFVVQISLALLIALSIGITQCYAQESDSELPEGVTKGASVEGITEYSLENGLRFLLFPEQSKNQITVNVTYFVGSQHEQYGETGMAHLLEHLVFKGSTNHPNITKELTDIGARPNGSTWYDRTNYFETFPASESNLTWAISMESDRMVNSFVSAEDLKSEMTVVRNEWQRGENNPNRMLSQRVASTAFLWHNYGKSTIGALSDIENMPIERIQAFYRKYYQPDNAIVIIAGRFDPQFAIELVREKFGAIPRPDRTGEMKIHPPYTLEPAQDGERTVVLRRAGDSQLVSAAFHVPAGSSEEFAAVDILAHILGNAPSGRLYRNVVMKELAASASAWAGQFQHPSLLRANLGVRSEDSIAPALEAMLATIEELVNEPPTEEEVDRAKEEYRASFEAAMFDPRELTLDLSEWTSMGDWRLFFLHRDRIEAVTAADVQAVAEKYLIASNRTIGYFIPTNEEPIRADTGGTPLVAEMVKDYKGREPLAQGEAFDPEPHNIDERTIRTSLSNGVKIAMLPKQNRGNTVTIAMTFNHGTEESLHDKRIAAELSGSLLMRGTNRLSRSELEDEFTRLKIRGSVTGGLTSAGGTLSTVRENLPDAIRLAAEILREPRFDEEQFKLQVESQLASIELRKSDPGTLASETIWRHLYPVTRGHPNYMMSSDERIEELNAVTVDDVKDFWKSFYSAKAGRISVVGDFDPDEILPLLEEAFYDWSSPEDYQRIPNPHYEQDAFVGDIHTPDKPNAIMYARMTIPLNDDHEDFPALSIGMRIMGGGFISSRLANRIRQKEGLSYGVRGSLTSNGPDERSMVYGYAIFAPEHADRVRNAFREEFERALAEGFSDEEVEAAKVAFLDSRRNARADDGTIASTLMWNMYVDRTMEWTADFEKNVKSLTTEAVVDAFRRHIDYERMSIVRAGDFADLSGAEVSDSKE